MPKASNPLLEAITMASGHSRRLLSLRRPPVREGEGA